VTKAPKRESAEKHVYLRDRMNGSSAGLELALWLGAMGVALLVAAYAPDGFWRGFLDALKQLLNRV
jgi:hypothetical protein